MAEELVSGTLEVYFGSVFMNPKSFLPLFLLWIFSGCAVSPELQSVRSECSISANDKFPRKIEEYVCRKFEETQVETGEVKCVSESYGDRIETTCKPVTKLKVTPYDAICSRDSNEERRRAFLQSCVPNTCFERYGNNFCNPPEQIDTIEVPNEDAPNGLEV